MKTKRSLKKNWKIEISDKLVMMCHPRFSKKKRMKMNIANLLTQEIKP
jgi:hypothetical protein